MRNLRCPECKSLNVERTTWRDVYPEGSTWYEDLECKDCGRKDLPGETPSSIFSSWSYWGKDHINPVEYKAENLPPETRIAKRRIVPLFESPEV